MSVLDLFNLLVSWAYENYFFCVFLFWAGGVLGWIGSVEARLNAVQARLNDVFSSQVQIALTLQELQERQPTWKRRRRLLK